MDNTADNQHNINDNNSQVSGQRQTRSDRRAAKLKAREQRAKQRRMKRFIIWAAALVVVLAAGYGAVQLASQDQGSIDGGAIADVDQITERDHVRGNEQSAVTLIEYSDFQCPACGAYYPIVERVNQELGDKIVFVYRNFPLATIHPFADLAARAAEAAGQQGKFWEMYNLLFENQEDWSSNSARDKIFSYAAELDLNLEQFNADIDSDEVRGKVRDDYASGLRANVNSTPSFFLNGQKVENPRSYNEFAQLLNSVMPAETATSSETVEPELDSSDSQEPAMESEQ